MNQLNELIEKNLLEATQGEQPKTTERAGSLEDGFKYFQSMAPHGFDIDSDNESLIRMLVAYFQDREEFASMYEFKSRPELSKGIMLMGTIGSGKTLIMQTFSNISQAARKYFPIIPCREVSRSFQTHGFVGINEYGVESFSRKDRGFDKAKPLTKCFDDLGAETITMHFGNTVNVMAEVLQDRYENMRYGMKTHLTTNLNKQDIIDQYGDRVYSRMKEMFNIVVLTGKDRRK